MRGELHLGISISHNSTASLIEDGVVLAAVCEERSRRKKNFIGYPVNAINECLKLAKINPNQISSVAFTTINNPGLFVKAQTNTEFSLSDYHDYYGEKYYGRVLEGKSTLEYFKWLRDDPKFNEEVSELNFEYLNDEVLTNPNMEMALFRNAQKSTVKSHLGIDESKILFLDHHTCHAYYAYYGSPFRGEDCIVLTLDGWGDGRNQTVWIARDNKLQFQTDSKENDIGRIYKMATLILGMRPDEHEFKVMGLAPYAKNDYALRAKSPLLNLSHIQEMKIKSKNRPKDLFKYLTESWKTERFDNIAGAVQMYTEELACELVQNIISETGIRRLVIGGGIAMNIKMNKAISELDEVREFFVCGSSGDESLSIGGCYAQMSDFRRNVPLDHLYLGKDIEEEFRDLKLDELSKEFEIKENFGASQIAEMLSQGEIIGVIRGRAEFGARALGNRSILANPSFDGIVQSINEAIKNRDFWMPFALSIIQENFEQIVVNPKGLLSPFMAISLDTVPTAREGISAGIHPYDKTVRPQVVSKDSNKNYYSILREFHNITGIPALLNTSFNIHGEPIVDTIEDAISTLRRSGLRHLYIQDNLLITKK